MQTGPTCMSLSQNLRVYFVLHSYSRVRFFLVSGQCNYYCNHCRHLWVCDSYSSVITPLIL
jgi:L-lysine 2,3-aminomutase